MNLTINGRQVSVDDSFQNLSREDQDATVEEISKSLPASKQEGSGVGAGFAHGVVEPINGLLETGKRFLGAGPGRQEIDPSYVPADVTHGSFNPLNWSPSQLPQKVAEMAPSMIPDIASGAAGAKLGKKLGGVKGAALGALLGSALSGWARTAGDTAKEATVARTGDANAESSTADLVRGGATAGAASLAAAALPTRLVPGMAPLRTVGPQGTLDAAKRYLATSAIGGAGAVGSDAATQAGLSVGTDKGLSIDPSRFPEAAVGGAATGALLASPKLVGDSVRAVNNREFGGANAEATANYATRLQDAGEGLGGLGNAKRDATAHDMAKTDLKNELRDSAKAIRDRGQLHPDLDNALQRAQDDKPITPKDLDLIESGTAAHPEGANAAYLARTLRMAQLAQGKGSYTPSQWAGGISGALDHNLGYMLNPTRILGGGIASLAGMHLLGLSNPMFAASVTAGYGGARMIDGLTGMRSPAKTMAEHFADRQAQLRLQPTTPQAPASGAPSAGPSTPWGPVPPAAGPTGPQVPPPGAPQAPQGPWGPKPLQTASVPPVRPPPAPSPLAAINPLALSSLQQRFKENAAERSAAQKQEAADFRANVNHAFSVNKALDKDYSANRAQAESVNKLGNADYRANQLHAESVNRNADAAEASAAREEQSSAKAEAAAAKAQARAEEKSKTAAERAQAKAERARVVADAAAAKAEQAKAKEASKAELVKAKAEAAKAKEAAKLEMAKVKAAAAAVRQAQSRPSAASLSSAASGVTADVPTPKKITKANGKVEADAPTEPFQLYEEHDLFPPDISAKQYAAIEKSRYGATSPRYEKRAERSAQKRIDAEKELIATFPQYRPSFKALVRQLHTIGANAAEKQAAIEHFASHVPDDVGNAMREAFK